MTIVINSDMKRRIDRVVSKDKGYDSMDEFVNRAILNLLAIEESEPGEGSLHRKATRKVDTYAPERRAHIDSVPVADKRTEVASSSLELSPTILAPPSQDTPVVDPPVSSSQDQRRPLWGQINRFAPAKISLRVLANMVASQKNPWVDLKVATATVCEQAPLVKSILQERDRKAGRKRGEGFSTAFPKDERPSLQRFANQYLGYLAKESGVPQGLLADLRFVNIRKSEDGRIEVGITEAGLRFAALHSPLIDDVLLNKKEASSPMVKEEVEFLVAHLREHKLGEFEFLRYVAGSVKNGAITPTALLNAVNDYFKKDSRGMSTITDAVVGTMRTGAVSKLVELGIISIKKDGTRSTYSLTEDSELVLGAFE